MLAHWRVSLVTVPLAVLTAMSTLHGDANAVRMEPAVQRYLNRGVQRVTTYRAFRRLEAQGMGQQGWLEAWTELRGNRFSYDVTAEGGSEGVRGRVLRKVLENEQQAWATGEVLQSELTEENYEFERSPEQPQGLVKVLMKPRRKGKLMLDGAMFLAREAADLVRVEGRAVSNPSFWIKRVDIKKDYQRIVGCSVPVNVVSIANIRFAGKATFRMSYQYAQINGQSTLGTVGVIASTAR
ncbi:MAG: hypothetical protein ACM36C_15555 [Acidobacteriota bacterium]